ncbi:hypothetical protein HNQ80_000099 [Anaerosolibacter carboniphilus]|uniref:CARDB protein n=1 Tax=Anaerosolibacter carboniphilus TaxID=1417629 RepID=A0A841KPK4_9FIRM|nr:hypothetical protein [Anaerosolibacter carboniphilus]MBB6214030.1 hypothetical protein [Anaerosolibacter carboniphilus]
MKRKLIYILIFIIVMATYPISIVDAEGGTGSPDLVIGKNTKMPVFKAGEEVRLAIPIENNGSGLARNVMVTPVIDDPNSYPFDIDEMATKRKIYQINGYAMDEAVFYFKVRTNVEEKIYPLKFSIEYSSRSGSTYNQSITINVKIENKLKIPSLHLNRVEIEGKKLTSGKTKSVTLHIENTGDLTVKDIDVGLGGFTNDGLILGNTVDTKSIKVLEGRKQQGVVFEIAADSDMESGTYSLDLTMNYKDEYNKTYKNETKIYLPVDGIGEGENNFSFDNITYPEGTIGTNSDFKISFDLKNIGDSEAKGIQVSVDGGNEILPKSSPVKNIKSLMPGESRNFEFVLFGKEGIESKNYPVKINVTYDVMKGKTKTTESISQYVGVLVNDQGSKSGVPKIIIDNYDYDGEFVKAGEAFSLNLSFLNTNRGNAVRNIKVSLSADDNIFSPVGSSNSFYIDEIAAGGRVQKTLTLKPKIDASYKTYNVTADIEYEDHKGEKLAAKEVISIPVIQEVKLLVSDAEVPTENFVGGATGISMDFYNVGRALIRNLMIRTEGDFEIRDGSLYVGNLEAGKDDYYDATIIPNKTGTLTGRVIFEYDNEIGEHYIQEKEFQIQVMEMPEQSMDDPAMEMPQSKKGLSKKTWAIVITILLGAGGGGFVWFRKRKKKLEEVTADE